MAQGPDKGEDLVMTRKSDNQWVPSKVSALLGALGMIIISLCAWIYTSGKDDIRMEFTGVKESIKNIERNTANIPLWIERTSNNTKSIMVNTKKLDKVCDAMEDQKKKHDRDIMDIKQLITALGQN